MIASLLSAAAPTVAWRAWVMSDLQQADPASARRCMTAAVRDFESLALPCRQIWYLGDAIEGHQPELLADMTHMQRELLRPLSIPVRYVLGNHDFDSVPHGAPAPIRTPFHEAVRQEPDWRTIDTLDQFYFSEQIGDFTVFFLSDHADPLGRWICTHGTVRRDLAAYPHGPAAYAQLRARIAAAGPRVITAGHLAFAGGNRPSDLLNRLLPLPDNVKLHLYGHAHIGDAYWAGKHLARKIAYLDYQYIPQIDVASLEDARGSAIRSTILQVHTDHSLSLFFRNHSTRSWDESLLLSPTR